MAEKVAKTGVTKEKGYLYYLDKESLLIFLKICLGMKMKKLRFTFMVKMENKNYLVILVV